MEKNETVMISAVSNGFIASSADGYAGDMEDEVVFTNLTDLFRWMAVHFTYRSSVPGKDIDIEGMR